MTHPLGYHAHMHTQPTARARARAAAARALDGLAERAVRAELRLEAAAGTVTTAAAHVMARAEEVETFGSARLRRVYAGAYDTARRLSGEPVPNRTPEPFDPETFTRFTARLRQLLDQKVEATLANVPDRYEDALEPPRRPGVQVTTSARPGGHPVDDPLGRARATRESEAWMRASGQLPPVPFRPFLPFAVDPRPEVIEAASSPLEELVTSAKRAANLEPLPQAYGSRRVLDELVAHFRTAPARYDAGDVFPGLTGDLLARPPFGIDVILDPELPDGILELRHSDGRVVKRIHVGSYTADTLTERAAHRGDEAAS